MQFMDVMAPLGSPAHYSSPHDCTETFNPQHKAGAQFTDPEGMKG